MLKFFEKNSKISWAITIVGAVAIFIISSIRFENVSIGYSTNALFLGISITKGEKNYLLFGVVFLLAVMYGI